MNYVLSYLVTLVIFFAIDLLWLGIVARKYYDRYIGHLRAYRTNWPAAVIFYAVFIAGLLYFAINPALELDSIKSAFILGAQFGFMTYFTYDMTNLATLKEWPVALSIVDIIWGTLLNSLTAGISFYIIKLLFL